MRDASITLQDVIEDFQKREDLKVADAEYYYNVARDWSDSMARERTGWLATIRNIARSDSKQGKLKLVPGKKIMPWER